MNENVKNNNSFRYENGKIIIGGVQNVNSFSDKEVSLRLISSVLILRGSGFKMEEMEVKSGLFCMEGTLSALNYHEKGEKTGFIKKLLK